ncbi:MAG: dihydrolipoamide dehydrogenase [Verrucomicrobia bacterium]|nr:dihydrolipoamide dehydrogenase [Verrucomicrobiota bacterium]
MLKRTKLFLSLFTFLSFGMNAQELPQPSPYSEVMQRVGLTDVTVKYSRPGVKDRIIFGDLEPFDQVWRTGANSSTKIEFSTTATIGGTKVEAGTYSIMSMPNEAGNWKVFINTDLGVQEGSYDAAKNVAEIEVKAIKTDDKVETMSFWFANVKTGSADLMFAWENTMWSIPIEVNYKEMAVKNIEEAIADAKRAFRVYNSSARYNYDNDLDLNQALEWSKKSVEMDEQFWNVYTLSLIQNKLGMKKEALATAKRSLELSEKADYQPYIKMNKENIANWSK